MKFRLLAAMCAATMLVGCTKCGQQAPETAPAETAPTEPATIEGTTSEAMPNTDQMNEELPPEPAAQ